MSKHLSVACQLYSVRQELAHDVESAFERLAEMGYEGVEFAGFFEKSAKEVNKLLKRTNLEPVSSHVPLQQIREDMRGVLDFHEEIGCPCIVVPYLVAEDRPGAPGFASVLRTLYTFGRLCKKRGITLLYHNHDFEFDTVSGLPGLDFLLEALPEELVGAELDTCWIQYAGYGALAYLNQYGRRCPVLHLMDYEKGEDGSPIFRPLGMGCMDIAALVDAAREQRVRWLVVEQDRSYERPPLEAVKISIDYLRTLL